MHLKRSELPKLLAEFRGAQITTIMACTVPAMKKTNNPFFGNCFKWSIVNGIVNWIYANSVNNQRARERQPVDFEPEERMWGEKVGPFIYHKGKKYLELKVQKSIGHQYMDACGMPIDPKALRPFLYKKVEGRRQRLKKPVVCRDYSLRNIFTITLRGQTYQLVD